MSMTDDSGSNSSVDVGGSARGNALQQMLISNDIVPGSAPSYQLCKTILSYHPLGPRLTEGPIKLSQSQKRKLSIPPAKDAEDRLIAEFERIWTELGCDRHLRNWAKLSRTYGVSALTLASEDPQDNSKSIDFPSLYQEKIAFSVFDPLNVAGSLVLQQIPTDPGFLKPQGITVMGIPYHRSRTVVLMNEEPIYLEYTTSAYGYVGRSVFQRPLYPLKSYVQTMIADDMVALKAGVLVIKTRQPGNIINRIMQTANSFKRSLVSQSATNNVISIAAGEPEEEISSINLENVNKAMETSRNNILENVAIAADMPSQLVKVETLAHGFSEGSEDAKKVAEFIEDIRGWMQPGYAFMDDIVAHVAWSPPFYETLKDEFPDQFHRVPYASAFASWRNNFIRSWPSLIEEPESDRVKVDEVKLKAAVLIGELLLDYELDPDTKATLVVWLAECFNERKILFPAPLEIDEKTLTRWFEQQQAEMDAEEEAKKSSSSAPGKKPANKNNKTSRSRTSLNNNRLNSRRLPDLSAERMKRKALSRSAGDS
jgi:hypothetical protein